MRVFIFGVVLIVGFSIAVLSARPGGLRQQLRFAARRFRILLILGGVYIVAVTAIRIIFPKGWIADYGPPVVATVLTVAFIIAAREPRPTPRSQAPSRRP